MKLEKECSAALRKPTAEERQMVEFAADCLKYQKHIWHSGTWGLLAFSLFLFWFGLDSEMRELWFFSGFFIIGVIWDQNQHVQNLKMVRAIRARKYKVAQGTCRKSTQTSRHFWVVHGSVGNSSVANIVFRVGMDVIKAMPGEKWNFLLVSSGKRAVVLCKSPDNEILLADRVENMWTYPYALDDEE